MVALPENSTNRAFVDYVTNTLDGVEHTAYIRYAGTDRTGASAQTLLKDVLVAIGAPNFRTTWRVIRVRTQMAGENFSFPQTVLPALSAFSGTGAGGYARDRNSEYVSFVGRSPVSGRRSLISLYGLVVAIPPTLRTVGSSGGTGYVSASVNALNATGSPVVSVDGSAVVWYYYVNFGRNSYWQKRLRIG